MEFTIDNEEPSAPSRGIHANNYFFPMRALRHKPLMWDLIPLK